ncbi:MAG: hypothetical protein JJU40_06780 [Rhodobacteraceae bacterium]|nr:hypothetical protein [Paracoccaceae bacterium]
MMRPHAPAALPEPAALRARLDALRSARGFLLPHHGALAAGAPELHDAYLAMYEALTVTPRHLPLLEKECVWLAILVVAREAVGTHHLELFFQAGGSAAQAEALISAAGAAPMYDALEFAGAHWQAHLPGLAPGHAYARALDAVLGKAVPPDVAALAMLAAQAARHSVPGTAHHLTAAYGLGIAEERIVEALSYLIWPRGVNCFLDACAVWHELMRAGEIAPSPRFRVWAEMPGLGAYDRDSGTAVGGFAAPTEES